MKIYVFYLKTSKNDESLYAFTINKTYRDLFKDTRDMNKFVYEKLSFTELEFNEFLGKYGLCELREMDELNFVCTYNEYSHLYDEVVMNINERLSMLELPPVTIFNDKYFIALLRLSYEEICDLIYNDSTYFNSIIEPNIFHMFYEEFKSLLKVRR